MFENKNGKKQSHACPPLDRQLCNGVQFVFAALAECVSTNPRPPAPGPAEALCPAWFLPVFFFGRQQKNHAACHQDVPQRVCVIVVVLCLRKDEHTDCDESAEGAGEQEEHPATPRGRVAVMTLHAAIHLTGEIG